MSPRIEDLDLGALLDAAREAQAYADDDGEDEERDEPLPDEVPYTPAQTQGDREIALTRNRIALTPPGKTRNDLEIQLQRLMRSRTAPR